MANGSLDSRQSEKRQLSIAISAMIVAGGAKEGTDRQSNRSAATATATAAAAPMIPVGVGVRSFVPTDLVKNE